ncbi:esterase-like activity of phytase family protein [Phytoactinopolyspora mesophila]|uniref:Esterase-like activity of phytase family protein n=1 Tax=Phytoactinopolyspora mesophila TaxID=2650750 RepID=A0A7K3LXR9_9ACTN|nr:esterase-like activity of phytase family protein [Phytoactinopolyspora mesophila]NDL55795.1 esterase-like activity of phytase family protein [Phytoactinopolyspora mesophila]
MNSPNGHLRHTVRSLVTVGGLTGLALVSAAAPGVAGLPAASERADWDLRVVGEYVVPKGVIVDGSSVGELSGLDYDTRTGDWFLIADDSTEGPPRFYRARIDIDQDGVHGVDFVESVDIRRTDGTLFPPASDDDPEVADPEAIRVDPANGMLWWASEGKRVVPSDGGEPQLVDPWVRQMSQTGRHIRQTSQPETLRMSPDQEGPRHNLTFEGLDLTADGRELVTAMEGPLYQDGGVPTVDEGAIGRLTWYNKRTGVPVRQHAYEIGPIPVPPVPSDAFADNGVTEILTIDEHRYLVLERSFAVGVGNNIRVYEIDVSDATDVLNRHRLADSRYQPVDKKLVVDFADLDLSRVDNIEGMSWGPDFATGEHSLVFVSDDNFNDSQVTQVIALAVRNDLAR